MIITVRLKVSFSTLQLDYLFTFLKYQCDKLSHLIVIYMQCDLVPEKTRKITRLFHLYRPWLATSLQNIC